MQLIRLDWDNITSEEAYKRCHTIRQDPRVKSLEIRQSAISGYHIYVDTWHTINPTLVYKLRRSWKDDGRRLLLDILFRKETVPKDILFVKKNLNGVEWRETPLFKWSKFSA